MKTRDTLIALTAALALFPASFLRADPLGEALDAPQLTWTTGGDAPWFAQTSITHDGVDAAQCGNLTNVYQSSWLETTVTGRVAVAYWWRISADPSYASLYVQTNGSTVLWGYEESDWLPQTISFAGGTNTIKWGYYTPPTNPTNWAGNAVWLDQVLATNITDLAPVFMLQPPATLPLPEYGYHWTNLSALVVGDIPMTYQWQRDGTNLAADWPFYEVNSPSLTIYPRTQAECGGEFRLVASNAWGVATSAVCTVSIVPSAPFVPSHEPADRVAALGGYFNLWASVYGSPPFAFQWYTNGTPVPDATNQWYGLYPATSADDGFYQFVVTNLQGAATSRVAHVTVSAALPTIVSGPSPEFQEVAPGDGASFSVQASGPEWLYYSWRKLGETNELTSSQWLNLNIFDPTNSGFYYAIANNYNGAVTSRVSVLAVTPVTALGLAVDAPGLAVTNHHGWYPRWTPEVTATNTHDGVCAARSPEIGDYEAYTFGANVVGPTNVSFWWRISAGTRAFLEVSVDGSVSNSISGETAWRQQTLALPAGDHHLAWTFRKEDAGYVGQDAAWVDQFAIGSTGGGVTNNEITNFTTGGSSPWFSQSAYSHDGVGAWQSGPLGDNQENYLETTVTGPGALTFWWAVESEECCDKLWFSVDGMDQTNIAGIVSWQQKSVTLAAGSHTLRWRYAKDGSDSVPRDAGWVDEVMFTPDLPSTGEITNFLTGGATVWYLQNTNTHDGIEAWQSGWLDDDEETWIETTVVGPGSLAFWWMVESEACCDRLTFSIGGVAQTNLAGLVAWRQETFPLPAGTNTLRWTYAKDGSDSVPRDAGWLNEVIFMASSNPPPVFTLAQALNATNLTFETGGDGDWFAQTTTSHDGVAAAQSGAIGDYRESWFYTSVQGPGTLSFWWKVSCDSDADYLELWMDGSRHSRITGEQDWTQVTLNLTSGFHYLQWRYTKDFCCTNGADAAWVDQVQLVQLATASLNLSFVVQEGDDGERDDRKWFLLFPQFNSVTPDVITKHLVQSPNALFQGAIGGEWGSSSRVMSTLDSLIEECTNGVWTLYLNKDDPSEQRYTFRVSISGLDTNLLGPVTIYSPARGGTNVPPNAPFHWTGPTNLPTLNAQFWTQYGGASGNTNLPSTATNWPSAATRSSGTNFFRVYYQLLNATNVTFTAPRDAALQPLDAWNATSSLFSSDRSRFVVSSASGGVLLQPQLTAGGLRFSFQTQSGQTHTLEARTNLNAGAWFPLTNFSGDGSVWQFTFPVTNPPTRFIRARTD